MHGDTLVEVMFAVGIFGLVAVSAISLMNRGLYAAQSALEISMARNEIDAQAEALRFIHNAYVSEQGTTTETYTALWQRLVSEDLVYTPSSLPENFFSGYNDVPCGNIYYDEDGENYLPAKSFVINPRLLNSEDINTALNYSDGINNIIVKNTANNSKLQMTDVYPRLVYANTLSNEESATGSYSDINMNTRTNLYENSDFYSAEGIWVTVVAEGSMGEDHVPDFYDFYIRTCWDAPGGARSDRNSSMTISTTIRLYNPDAITLECIVHYEGQTCAPDALERSGIFIVMNWSGSNLDIDAHLIGADDGKQTPSQFHVYYSKKTAGEYKVHDYILDDGTHKVVEGYTLQLDVDALRQNYNYNTASDTWNSSGSGDGKVEVIAIRSLYPAKFHYYLHDYANGGLANQNLRVRVYVGYATNGVGQWPRYNDPVMTFNFPGGSGRYWDVCNIIVEGSGLITVETIDNVRSSAPSI